MLTLYHSPRSRSSRFIWLLEEIGTPYEIVQVDIPRQDGTGASDPRNPHPDRKVPAIVHDGVLVTESAAICAYLADAFPESGLGPRIGDPLRGPFLTWLAYYAGVVEPAMVAKATGLTETDANQKKAYDQVVQRLEGALAAGPFILGEGFSAADVLIASVFQWGRNFFPPSEAIDHYVARIGQRPALQRAVAKDG